MAAVQAIQVVYVISARPYLERGLQWLEVLCHLSELVIFLGAIASMVWGNVLVINIAMIGECNATTSLE